MFAFCLAKFGKEVMHLVSTKSSQSLPPGASHQVVSSNSGHPDMSFHHPVKRSLEGEKAQRFNGHACDKTFWPFFGPFRWGLPRDGASAGLCSVGTYTKRSRLFVARRSAPRWRHDTSDSRS